MSPGEIAGSDVTIDVQHIESRGFDGIDSLITVVTMVTSGVAGGLTAAIGESAWAGVRNIVRGRKERKEPERVIVVVVRDGPAGERRLSCVVEDERDVARFATAVDAIDKTDRSILDGDVTMRYDVVDGEWSDD